MLPPIILAIPNVQTSWRNAAFTHKYKNREALSVENFVFNVLVTQRKFFDYAGTAPYDLGGAMSAFVTNWNMNPVEDLYTPSRTMFHTPPRFWELGQKKYFKFRRTAFIRFRRDVISGYRAETAYIPSTSEVNRPEKLKHYVAPRPKKLVLKPIQDISARWMFSRNSYRYSRRIQPFTTASTVVGEMLRLQQPLILKSLLSFGRIYTRWGSDKAATPTRHLSAPRDISRFRRQVFRFWADL